MKKHFKYELQPDAVQDVALPRWYQLLKVGEEGGKLFLWALVDPDQPDKETIEVFVCATGEELDDYFDRSKIYLDTVICSNGLVWHVWYR